MKKLNIRSIKNKKFISIVGILQSLIIFSIAYNTSFILRPFIDEIISLSAATNFFQNLNFSGPKSTMYETPYNPNLTTGPLSAFGSYIGWSITKNIYYTRIFNFIYLYIIQIIFSFLISKQFKLQSSYVIIFSSFAITSVPWWYSSLYSLGDLTCTIIFINSLFLYKKYKLFSIFIMSLSIFYGRILLLIPFISFYLYRIYKNQKLQYIFREFVVFLIPPLGWVLLAFLNSKNFNLYEYIKYYIEIYYTTNPSIAKPEENSGFFRTLFNIKDSDLRFWNPADFLRVLISPIIFILLLNLQNAFKNSFIKDLKNEIMFSFLFFYLAFWLLSPTKSIIYSQIFTIIVLYCTLLLFVENVEGNTFYQFIAFILISLYFSSIFIIISGIFLFSLVRYFKINVDIRNLLIVFLILSQVNALVETFEKDRFEDINYNSCKKDLRTITCVEDYLETSYFE